MLGRKPKYNNPRNFPIYVDEKDLDYLDDHRGKIARGEYLIQCMYASKGDHSKIQENLTAISRYQNEILELKRQLLFEQSKNKKQAPTPEINESELIRFYEDKNIAKSIKKFGTSINWQNLFDKNLTSLSRAAIKDSSTLENWCLDRFKNNGNNILERV